jgi:hypothetical protein
MTYTVTIAGVTPDPEVYAGLVKVTAYIGKKFGPEAAKWRALTPDDKARTIASATDYVDMRSWDGLPTFLDASLAATTLQFPRSGGGITDSAAVQLARVEQAIAELSIAIAVDPGVLSAIDQGSNVKVLDADGAKIEFFAPISVTDGTATRMPAIVQRLLGRYTAASSDGFAISGGASYGVDGESSFDECDEMKRSSPY